MSCLTLTVKTAAPAAVTADVMPGASLDVTPGSSPSLEAVMAPGASVDAVMAPGASVDATPSPGMSLEVGAVCSVSSGTLVVLAGSDGPFRTRDGGYFLLNPETSPATRSRSRRR